MPIYKWVYDRSVKVFASVRNKYDKCHWVHQALEFVVINVARVIQSGYEKLGHRVIIYEYAIIDNVNKYLK